MFENTVWHLGTIRESDAPLTHIFTFENRGTSPVVIERALASCGCTKVEFPKYPVMPAATDSVLVTFDPRGRHGGVIKMISLISANGRMYNNLQINGTVLPSDEAGE